MLDFRHHEDCGPTVALGYNTCIVLRSAVFVGQNETVLFLEKCHFSITAKVVWQLQYTENVFFSILMHIL